VTRWPGKRFLLGLTVLAVVLVAEQGAASGESPSVVRAERVIAFERGVSRRLTEIYVMNANGQGERSLGHGCCFVWSPDGGKLAVRTVDGIHVINVDGSGARRLTRDKGDAELGWSPDGRKIIFKRAHAIYVVNADGSGMRPLTTPRRSERDAAPVWSPDGRRIAWVRRFDIGYDDVEQLFLMNANGSGQHKLARNLRPYSVSWSPNGRRFACDCWNGDNYDIYVMDADGSHQHNLTPSLSDANDDGPVWSPDGEQIAFESIASAQSDYEIHVIRADGTARRGLTRSRGFDGAPDWSPDGRSIVYMSERDGNFDIYVMTATGRRQTNLTHNGHGTRNSGPAWSPARR
jgi:Tol biopolymer transport system component